MSAPQEFRDGAGYGARTLAQRLVILSIWGIKLSDTIIRQTAEGVAEEMGAHEIEGQQSEAERWGLT